jgi:hypothetical protein
MRTVSRSRCRRRGIAVSVGVWAIFRYVSMPIALFAGLLPLVLALASY